MPCNTIQTNTVELSKIANPDLFLKGLRAEFGTVAEIKSTTGVSYQFVVNGYTIVVNDGRAVSQMPKDQMQKVIGRAKQAYSREVVQFAAKTFGWQIQKKGAFHFQVVKR